MYHSIYQMGCARPPVYNSRWGCGPCSLNKPLLSNNNRVALRLGSALFVSLIVNPALTTNLRCNESSWSALRCDGATFSITTQLVEITDACRRRTRRPHDVRSARAWYMAAAAAHVRWPSELRTSSFLTVWDVSFFKAHVFLK